MSNIEITTTVKLSSSTLDTLNKKIRRISDSSYELGQIDLNPYASEHSISVTELKSQKAEEDLKNYIYKLIVQAYKARQ